MRHTWRCVTATDCFFRSCFRGPALQVETIDCVAGLSEWQARLAEAEQQGDIVAQVGSARLGSARKP